jgi:formate dehydrogenase accessory protein FdhE
MGRPETSPATLQSWARRRRRTRQLLERHGFVRQLLGLYSALLDTQERAFQKALDDRPRPGELARYVATHVIADVAATTVAAGPTALASAVPERLRGQDPAAWVVAWLSGEQLAAVDEYLARAAAGPVLEALGPAAGDACGGVRAGDGCPRCGGPPQVSYFTDRGEALVSGPRMLLCGRCGESWGHPRMTCAGCGETSTGRLPIFADYDRFPHLRADACESCHRYVITVDLRRDPEAVPVVDELAALPLDLSVQARGFAKITPNLMAIG